MEHCSVCNLRAELTSPALRPPSPGAPSTKRRHKTSRISAEQRALFCQQCLCLRTSQLPALGAALLAVGLRQPASLRLSLALGLSSLAYHVLTRDESNLQASFAVEGLLPRGLDI